MQLGALLDSCLAAGAYGMSTGRQADVFGFTDRGRIRTGAYADLVVFPLDELRWDRDEMVSDLPHRASRLRRPPGGYRWTVVGGTITQRDGVLTDARPGRVLRR
ncbi:MAG: amidohydrolase family protein [Acidimicrobiales bacterium]